MWQKSGNLQEIAVSALKVSKPSHPKADAEPAANPEGSAQDAHGWHIGDLKAHGDGSPARKLQSLLAERLHHADRMPVRGTLAMLAVVCLSLSVAGLYLMTIA